MIEARNFYWKEATKGEPRSTQGDPEGKHKLVRFHPLPHLWNIPECTCCRRRTLLSTLYRAYSTREIDKKTSQYNIMQSLLRPINAQESETPNLDLGNEGSLPSRCEI